MKQVFQSLSTGSSTLPDLPSPSLPSGHLLIRSTYSLVSAGTERMLVDFGKANLIDKARQQPDKVQDVLNKARTDGILSTFDAVKSKLDKPLPLGYSNVGIVVDVASDVLGFKAGDRVVSNAPHAELVTVPKHLCARIPDVVSDEDASFTVLASIGLQGIRLSKPTFGETFVVSGLGLIGLLAIQLLKAQGCRVIGLDPDPAKCELAQKLGVTALRLSSDADPIEWCLKHTDGVGVDGVLITASTSSSDPVHLAAQVCRQRGRIVLVGVTGLELRRDLFYKKELSFQVSCSYGPGRYDPSYEQKGHDYPIGYVRWTEQRNFQAVLHALEVGTLRTDLLVTHRFPIIQAYSAYDLLTSSEPSLGILLHYPNDVDPYKRTIELQTHSSFNREPNKPVVSVIGAGNYAGRVLIPAFAKAGAEFHSLVSSNGLGPVHFGSKFGFKYASTDTSKLLSDTECNSLVIATRHDSHAALVRQALSAGKNVFVEKPLCLSIRELEDIEASYTGSSVLMVGFNRRFSPLIVELKRYLGQLNGPKAFVYTCNSGFIPSDHWIQDPAVGGGRLLGEACHFVDLLRHIADCSIVDLQLISASDTKPQPDTLSLSMRFVDGSIGTVHYFSNGSKAFPKERLEVFSGGKVIQLDNFRRLRAWGFPGFKTRRLFSQDKGQVACCQAFLKAIQDGGPSPILFSDIVEVQRLLLGVITK